MKPRANALFSIGLAAGLAMLSYWLERIVDAPQGTQPDLTRHDPDYIVNQLNTTNLDSSGRPESKLAAVKMTHFPDNQTTELEAPRLVQLRDRSPPVHIAADRGTVLQDGDEVRLYDNVVVRRESTPNRPELRLETTYLQVLRNEEVARTPEYVVITEGRSRLTGIGMAYNNRTRQLELKSRVNGTYERSDG